MTILSEDEQRRFTRIAFDADVHLLDAEGAAWSGRLIDVSLKGALVSRPETWTGRCGADFALQIELDSALCLISMQARVAHLGDDRIGFECRHIDLDSMVHLRRLLELNLGDEQRLERELGGLVALNTRQGPRSVG